MQEILTELNKDPGIKGSMIVTEDGLTVQEELGPTLDKDTVSALSASVILSTKRLYEEIGWGSFNQFVLTASHGRMVFYDLDGPFLVVVTDMNIKLDQIFIEIASAANKIQKKRQIRD
ncbi:MAG: hypothetical protein D6805_07855 [Planctomycetota bacterium]|nr:MAG: hypothetical protein D6805_07855 [Planctomycetota bacterium]